MRLWTLQDHCLLDPDPTRWVSCLVICDPVSTRSCPPHFSVSGYLLGLVGTFCSFHPPTTLLLLVSFSWFWRSGIRCFFDQGLLSVKPYRHNQQVMSGGPLLMMESNSSFGITGLLHPGRSVWKACEWCHGDGSNGGSNRLRSWGERGTQGHKSDPSWKVLPGDPPTAEAILSD